MLLNYKMFIHVFGYFLFIIVYVDNLAVAGDDYYVQITSDAPIVQGATVTFKAHLFDRDGKIPSASFKYEWEDNGIPRHYSEKESTLPTDTWSVSYTVDNYPPGPYDVQVVVSKFILIMYYPITSMRMSFNITEHLNGKLDLIQKHKTLTTNYVSSTETVEHKIVLKDTDARHLNNSATSIQSFWFVDCVYYGVTPDYTFLFNYTNPEKQYTVETLVVAGYEPITTPAPTTTTIAPTTSTTTMKPNNVTTKPTTTVKPNSTIISTATVKKNDMKKINDQSVTRTKRNIKDAKNMTSTSGIWVKVNGTLVPYNGSFPFVCLNGTVVAPDAKKTYGYFSRKMIVKEPVGNLTVKGNNWLQHGDVLSLLVKCQGSKLFNYCVHFHKGKYNITGNESCINPDSSEKCEFTIQRYFSESLEHTVVIVIYNDVGKIISPVTVTVYQATKQAQLSVIVIPVAFSIVAVVLVVFGVAYYIQNRSRFTIEVADFNFGQRYSDMEYKTFRERLRDEISNAFMRTPTPGSSEPTVWPPGRKYGSLAS